MAQKAASNKNSPMVEERSDEQKASIPVREFIFIISNRIRRLIWLIHSKSPTCYCIGQNFCSDLQFVCQSIRSLGAYAEIRKSTGCQYSTIAAHFNDYSSGPRSVRLHLGHSQ
jgi:hypothetical protein